MYDYYLGGLHNFTADRRMAQEAIRMWPELPQIMQANRAFLRRAVRYIVGQGVTQILDIGSGIPTVGNSHEVAQQADPHARVAYVDADPVAVAHSRAILADNANTVVLQADLREPELILADPEVNRIIDFDRPVVVLLIAVLHFMKDEDDPAGVIAALRNALAPGSYLAISHASPEGQDDRAANHQKLYSMTPTPMTMRSQSEIREFFAGFDLVEPGLVRMPAWRPDLPYDVDEPNRVPGFAGVGRRR